MPRIATAIDFLKRKAPLMACIPSPQSLVLATFSLLLICCAGQAKHDTRASSRTATIEIVDKPDGTFRYVRWENEDYGPEAFVALNRGKFDALVLVNPNDAGLRCAAALSSILSVPAATKEVEKNIESPIAPSGEPVKKACGIDYEAPHPPLANGHFYVVRSTEGIALEGEMPLAPSAFAASLRTRGASALVMRNPTIGDLACFGAIANSAHVELFEVSRDGTFATARVNLSGGSIAKSCSY